ncbi:MAG: 4-hydroxythreonine-4-phosphate dehydrogenase PdxA [Gemmatales bacterium]|nr:4-hydroxythreonine-4-phosphate dehydrogenase PdxA [Gemmatales bacterium]MDW7995756.1 4-hydroxythreonine-4-phosphate dehydrogenase PdxA [Gemmatales bacterium]
MKRPDLPRLLITLGDVAGIGPEIVLRAWPRLVEICLPTVVGDVASLRRHAELLRIPRGVESVDEPVHDWRHPDTIACLQATEVDLGQVRLGQVDAACGRAAYDFVCRAVQEILRGQADALVTAPLHKEALAQADLKYPGHTEMLAELSGVTRYAMMLFAYRSGDKANGNTISSPEPPFSQSGQVSGWGVAHVTLHLRLRDVFLHLTQEAVLEKIELLGAILRHLLRREPRLAVCGLNPHASDGGLFGDEEACIIKPAIEQAQARGWQVSGPWPADTLFGRAARGEMEGIVAMYHDQGHIPFKLLAGLRAVNITLGLPFVRTSVAHGTAFDIAGRGCADPTSLVEAARVAVHLVQSQRGLERPGPVPSAAASRTNTCSEPLPARELA